MPPTRLSGAGALRATAVALVAGLVWLAAACSDEDTVDTVPPPWPTSTSVTTTAVPGTGGPTSSARSTGK